MVWIRVNAAVRDALAHASSSDEQIREALQSEDAMISHKMVARARSLDPTVSVKEVVRISDGVEWLRSNPDSVKEVRSPELEARLEVLRRRLEEKKYRAMVADVAPDFSRDEAAGKVGVHSFRAQASMGANVIATMLTTFAIGYYLCSVYFQNAEKALVGGIVGLTIGLLVDVIIVVLRVYSIDKHEREESNSERKHQ